MNVFEVGQAYKIKSIQNYTQSVSFEVIRRTAKSVWLKSVETVSRCKVIELDGTEAAMPMGSFINAPTLFATNQVES
jgi:hypothetical protein